MINKDSLKYKVNLFLLLLTAFLLPLHKDIMTFAIGVLFLSSIWNRKKSIKSDLNFLYLISYYIILILGVFISSNKSLANSVLEVSASMVIFPIIFMISNINFKEVFHKVMIYFIEGVVISFLISFIFSVYKWYSGYSVNPYFYTEISPFHHTSYMAMYCSIGIAYLYYVSLNPIKSTYINSGISKVVITLLSVFTIMLMSKTGILVVFLIHLTGISYWIIKHNKVKAGLAYLSIILLTIIIVGTSVKAVQTRFIETYEALFETEHSETSSGSRLIGWNVSWEIFKESPWIGIGTGDINLKMSEKYIETGHSQLAFKSLNSHNQFLTTLVQSGFIGFIGLLIMFLYPLFQAFKTKVYFYSFFLLILFFNFMTESMLQTQSGILFIAFTLSLLLGVMNNESQNNQHIKNLA